MESFSFTGSSPRVVFGAGSIRRLPEELRRLEVKRPVIACSPTRLSLATAVRDILNTASIFPAGILDRAVVHVPVDITAASIAYAEANGADSVISVGGGSAIGLGKAICLRTQLRHICIPTTYSGSEMTAILGEVKDGRKVAMTDGRILPSTVIYDVDLTSQLQKRLTAASGLNAMAHAVEALYSEGANPVASLIALESLKTLCTSLLRVVVDPHSTQSRSSVLYGACLAGMAVASTGVALQHKLAHTVAGSCNLPHAETHAILLPHTIAYNLPSLPSAVVESLGVGLVGRQGVSADEIAAALSNLLRSLEIPSALKDIGMRESDILRSRDMAMENQYWNPRPLEKEKIGVLIQRAWAGEWARADL